MKHFDEHLNESHLKIVSFFKQHGFGTNNPVLTYLSVLAPVDRCIILEQLYSSTKLDSVLSDKLLLAYVTYGRKDLAQKVIDNSIRNGESDINVWGLKDKISLGLAPNRNKEQRLKICNDFLSETTNATEVAFLNLLIDFCNKNYA